MGTMLQQSGEIPGEVPELLNLLDPARVARVHRAYAEAGSRLVYANTFGANGLKLKGSGHSVAEVVGAGVRLAKAAVDRRARVAVDIGPLGALLEPMGSLTFEEAYALFTEMARAGAEAGADAVAIETMTDLAEARAALLAAKESCALPVLVTMSFDGTGRTFTGCTVEAMACVLATLGADAIGFNCSVGPAQLIPLVRRLRAATSLPIVVKPNAGLPDPVNGRYDLSPEAFAREVAACVRAGASVVGGCCGTSPAYIRALNALADEPETPAAPFLCPDALATASRVVTLDRVRVIGERINPTGKKRLQQALLAGDVDYIAALAVQQQDAGAEILDVNVGYPGVDETVMLPRVVKKLQSVTDLPLQLDSVNPRAVEAALRVYTGRAAVNSVSGRADALASLLPVVRRYGACVVGLTLDEDGLPDTADKRVQIAERILSAAENAGIPRRDVWIDCLTLTVSAQQEQAMETLAALRRMTAAGVHTVLGVSNISFGLPARLTVTATFLTAALAAGLTLPIVNPNQREIMDVVAAFRALNGDDAGCRDYVARFAGRGASAPQQSEAPTATLADAVIRGLGAEAARLAREALREEDELSVVERRLIPALDQVGEDYERGAAFLPQLLAAAQAAQQVFEVLRASMAEKGDRPPEKGCVLLATVRGDIHDIGKNIVKTVLENYGFRVIDLGRDVPPEEIVRRAEAEKIRLVGLSALMTTTLPAMAETVRLLHALPEPPVTVVGGAVVTARFAEQIGADYYAKDARATVEVARRVFQTA